MEPIKLRTHAQKQTTTADVDDVPDSYYNTRLPTSARRYYQPDGSQVIEQGNKRIIVHQGKPPRRIHWLALLGMGMILMLLLWAGLSWLVNWVQNNQLNATYEFPRISQAMLWYTQKIQSSIQVTTSL